MDERLIGGRYRVTGTLGHGGMASVYRAVDEQLGREVAVKLFRMGTVDHGERARAESEIQVLAGLRSPSLVTLYDAALDDADGDSYLVMELVPGSDLATRLREGPLDPATTARVGAQVAEGLAAVHVQGIVHRDVKPANVLLEQDGEHVKLADFGIALLRDAARVTGTGTVIGTAAYLAPEQVLGTEVTGKADVYALGLMLLEALTGRQAFPGSAVEAATARLARAPEIDQKLPTAWRTLLFVMTQRDPGDRPTAAEAAARLRALGRDDAAPATQLLPGGPGAVTAAAAGLGAAGAAAAAGGAQAAAADEATRAMPVSGASRPDDATRVMPTQSRTPAQDDVATTLLGAPGAGRTPDAGGPGGGRGGVVPGGPAAVPVGQDDEPRKRRWVLPLVVLAVLVVAGIVVAVFAANRDDGTPSPTESSQPSQPADDQQPSDQPSQQPSQEQQEPSQPAQQPSQPAQEPSQPAEEPSQPAQEPTVGPEPSVQPTLPVQTPLDGAVNGAVDTTADQLGAVVGPGAGGAGKGGSGPGKSGDAPGHGHG